MAKLSSFIMLTIDGCYADAQSDMSWAHQNDPEIQEFTSSNASGGGRLLFGRITYDMMASFWPTPVAAQQMPVVAKGMNEREKFVVSRSMTRAEWANTTVLRGDFAAEIARLRADGGEDIVILGSGSVVAKAAEAGLLDELQVLRIPVSVGPGKHLFDGANRRMSWKAADTRTFRNGSVFTRYQAA